MKKLAFILILPGILIALSVLIVASARVQNDFINAEILETNNCVSNVEQQFKNLGRIPGGARKPSARIRVQARDKQFLPPEPNDFLERIDHDNKGNHIQGFTRIPGDDNKWIAISVGTSKGRLTRDAGFVLAHLGDLGGNEGNRFVKAGQNRDIYKEAPPANRVFKYFYPVGGKDFEPKYSTHHPGGIQAVGNLLFITYKARQDKKDAMMDIWDVSVPSAARLRQTVKIPNWEGKKRGALYVAATQLPDGKYLAIINRGDDGKMTILKSNTSMIDSSTSWNLVASANFADFKGWWTGNAAYQNVNLVTECGTGQNYLLAMRQKCCGWNADNSVHLFKFNLRGNRVSLQKVNAIHPDGERNDWCEMRGGSGIYVAPNHEMIIYCCRGVVGKGRFLKISEHTVNK